MDRRQFAAGVLAAGALLDRDATAEPDAASAQQPAAAPTPKPLNMLSSGTFEPGPAHEGAPGRTSRQYLLGMLRAGNIRLEMHETMQKPGAVHEPVGTHLHNEIWCVQRGTASLYIKGTEHRLRAGDVGLVCAGDKHWIANVGDDELAYFVITIGPPE